MRLAKKEIGELALQVLKSGEAVETLLLRHLDSNISSYTTPETNRVNIREKIATSSDRFGLYDKLNAIRS